MKTTPVPSLPRPPDIMRAACPEAKATADGMYPFFMFPSYPYIEYPYYIPFFSDYLWKLNNMLFKTFSWIYTDLKRYRAEGEMYVYVSDIQNTRIAILDLDLNWVNSFDVAASYELTGDSTHLYAGHGQIDKYLRSFPHTLVDSEDSVSSDDMDSDDDYIYIGGSKDGVWKILIHAKSDLSLVDEFDTGIGPWLNGITVDDTYIYVYDTHDTLKKFKKSDHSEVASVHVYDDGIYTWFGMDCDSNYLYFTAGENYNGELIAVYNKSDLSQYKVITIAETDYAWDVAVYGGFAYQSDYGDHVIRKVRISNGEVVATFGEEGVLGTDTSHLQYPDGIAVI